MAEPWEDYRQSTDGPWTQFQGPWTDYSKQVTVEEPKASFVPGLKAGVEDFWRSAAGQIRALGTDMDSPKLREVGDELLASSAQRASELPPAAVTDIRDIHSFEDLQDWFLYNLGQTTPMIGASTVGGIVGGVVGSAFGGVGAAPGAAVGAAAANYLYQSGARYVDLLEKGLDKPNAARYAAFPLAALDSLDVFRIGGRIAFRPAEKVVTRGISAALAKGAKTVGTDIAVEAGTEGAQEVIEAVEEAGLGIKPWRELATPEFMAEVLNATAAGGAVALPFSVTSVSLPESKAKPRTLDDLKREDLEGPPAPEVPPDTSPLPATSETLELFSTDKTPKELTEEAAKAIDRKPEAQVAPSLDLLESPTEVTPSTPQPSKVKVTPLDTPGFEDIERYEYPGGDIVYFHLPKGENTYSWGSASETTDGRWRVSTPMGFVETVDTFNEAAKLMRERVAIELHRDTWVDLSPTESAKVYNVYRDEARIGKAQELWSLDARTDLFDAPQNLGFAPTKEAAQVTAEKFFTPVSRHSYTPDQVVEVAPGVTFNATKEQAWRGEFEHMYSQAPEFFDDFRSLSSMFIAEATKAMQEQGVENAFTRTGSDVNPRFDVVIDDGLMGHMVAPVEKNDPYSFIGVNPFEYDTAEDGGSMAEVWAATKVGTLNHELAHFEAPHADPDTAFIEALERTIRLTASFADKYKESFRRLHESYTARGPENDFARVSQLYDRIKRRPRGSRSGRTQRNAQAGARGLPTERQGEGGAPSNLPTGERRPAPVRMETSPRYKSLSEAYKRHVGGEYKKWYRQQLNRTVAAFFGRSAIKGTPLQEYADVPIKDIIPQWPRFMKDYFSFPAWVKRQTGEVVDIEGRPAMFTPHQLVLDRADDGLKKLVARWKEKPPTPPRRPGDVDSFEEGDAKNLIENYDKWGFFTEWGTTLLQIANDRPEIASLQKYVGLVRQFAQEKILYMKPVEDLMRRVDGLGERRAGALTNFMVQVAVKSKELGRRLTVDELVEFRSDPETALDTEMQEVYREIDGYFRKVLDDLETVSIAEIERIQPDPLEQVKEVATLQTEIAALRNTNYFPFMRFGQHAVVVKARKNGVVFDGTKRKAGHVLHMETFETKWQRDKRLKALQREYAGEDFNVLPDQLQDPDFTFQGFNQGLVALLAKDDAMKLTEEQTRRIREMLIEYSPGRTFVKHMKSKRGTPGFSRDLQRILGTYGMSAGSHIARMKFRGQMRESLQTMSAEATTVANPVPRRRLYRAMEEHYGYLYNPGNELGALRTWIFNYYFAFVPKQLVVNLTQIPMFAYPYLAATYGGGILEGDTKAALAIAKAAKDVMGHLGIGEKWYRPLKMKEAELLNHLSPFEREMLGKGILEGFLDESMPTEVAGIAHGGSVTAKLLPGFSSEKAERGLRHVTELGVTGFKMSEEFNRRVTFLAALRLAKEKGISDERAYRYAREAVDKTMFEYARWNRFKVARGKKSFLFVFKTYMQHALRFYLKEPGRGRSLLMLLAMGGIAGLPGADDLMEIIDGLGSWSRKFFGFEGDPRVAVEEDIRKYVAQIGLNPDRVMNGLLRDVYGLDISSSVQMGRLVPGIEPAMEIAKGTTQPFEAMGRMAVEMGGAGASVGMNFVRAVAQDTPASEAFLRLAMPKSVNNAYRAKGYIKEGAAIDPRTGGELVNFDLTTPRGWVEVTGQLLGAYPTRLREVQARNWAAREAKVFYESWKEGVVSQYARAMAMERGQQRTEAIARAKERFRWYQRSAPPPLRIRDLRTAIRSRIINRKKSDAGLPTTKRFFSLYKEINEAYPTSPQPPGK